MKRIYLHIGHQKTGTTMIQAALARNAARLAERGILYPAAGRINNAHYGFNFALGIGQPAGPVDVENPDTLRKRLAEEVLSSGCERIVISSEYFSIATSVNTVRDYFSEYEVRIIVYLRRHDHALESAYGQAALTTVDPPWQPNIDSFILYQLTANNVLFDYIQGLMRWATQFGRDAVIVRPYERSQNRPDLLADFLKTIEVDDSDDFERPGEVNSSLSGACVSAIQAVRQSAIPEPVRRAIIGRLVQIEAPNRLKGHYLSPAMRHMLIRRYAASYNAIAREYLGRQDGLLFEEPVPPALGNWAKVAEITDREKLDLILRAVALDAARGGLGSS